MDPRAILEGVPTPFVHALEKDKEAMARFLNMPIEGKRALVCQTKKVRSRRALEGLATTLHV